MQGDVTRNKGISAMYSQIKVIQLYLERISSDEIIYPSKEYTQTENQLPQCYKKFSHHLPCSGLSQTATLLFYIPLSLSKLFLFGLESFRAERPQFV